MDEVIKNIEPGVVDFNAIFGEAIAENMTPEKLKPIIAKALNETVKSTIEEQFRWNGGAKKAIEAQIQEAMSCDVKMGLPSYNEQISRMVRDMVDNQFKIEGAKRLKDTIEEILQVPPETIKLSELIETFKEETAEDSSDDSGDITCRIYKSYDWSDDLYSIELDEKRDQRKYDCSIRLSVSKDTGKVDSVHAFGFNPESGHLELFAKKYLYGTKKLVFQLYAGGSKIDMDVTEDEVDTSYSREEEEY